MFPFSRLSDALIASSEKILSESPVMACEFCGDLGECQHSIKEDGVNDPGVPPVPVPDDLDKVEKPAEAETEELSGETTEVEVNPEMTMATPFRLRQ